MTRSDFLKSLAVLIASPSIVRSISVIDQPKLKTKKYFYYKVCTEMLEDKEYLEYFDKVIIPEQANYHGINLDKPFNYEIGFNREDFETNLITILVSQYE